MVLLRPVPGLGASLAASPLSDISLLLPAWAQMAAALLPWFFDLLPPLALAPPLLRSLFQVLALLCSTMVSRQLSTTPSHSSTSWPSVAGSPGTGFRSASSSAGSPPRASLSSGMASMAAAEEMSARYFVTFLLALAFTADFSISISL